MSGRCVEKLSHSCGSRDGLQVFEDKDGKYTGFCFKCGTFIPNPYDDPDYKPSLKLIIKTPEEIQQEIEDINSYPCLDLPDRKLRKESLEYFGVKIGVNEEDGVSPAYHFYPYEDKNGIKTGYKVRVIENKKMWCVGTVKGAMFFGWQQAINTGAKKLFITEGELDAISLFQIIKDQNRGTPYAEYNPAVVSLCSGSSSAARDILKHILEIRKHFKEIIYIPDMDEPGKKAADEIARAIPDVIIASLPCKDVNDCLMEGRSKAVYSAVMFKANKPKNTKLLYGSSLKERAMKKPEWGLSWPWNGMTKATRGIRRGETLYFGAGVKMGKSELVNALAKNIVVDHNLPVFLIKPEEAVAKTYQMLVGKAAKRIFHDPNIPFDEEAFMQAEPLIGDKAIILDCYQFLNWDSLKDDIRYVVNNEGVKDVFIDPITCLTNQMGTAEANEFLVSMAAELSSMSKDLDFTSYIFCHLKAPTSGEPHERGGEVLSHQFAGSRAMMRSCNYMIGLEGNKDPALPLEQRNVRNLVILEDREFGSSEKISLYWDYKTGIFSEIE